MTEAIFSYKIERSQPRIAGTIAAESWTLTKRRGGAFRGFGGGARHSLLEEYFPVVKSQFLKTLKGQSVLATD